MQRHSPPYPIRRPSSLRVEPCRRHRKPPKAKSYLRSRGKSSTRVYMSVGCGIIRRMKVKIYRRNGGDIWPWQGDLVFVTKNRVGHKRMRPIARLQRPNDITRCNQKIGRLFVVVCDPLDVHELQGRNMLPNQGSSYIISQRLHLIRLQGAINEDDRVRLLLAANHVLSNFSS